MPVVPSTAGQRAVLAACLLSCLSVQVTSVPAGLCPASSRKCRHVLLPGGKGVLRSPSLGSSLSGAPGRLWLLCLAPLGRWGNPPPLPGQTI